MGVIRIHEKDFYRGDSGLVTLTEADKSIFNNNCEDFFNSLCSFHLTKQRPIRCLLPWTGFSLIDVDFSDIEQYLSENKDNLTINIQDRLSSKIEYGAHPKNEHYNLQCKPTGHYRQNGEVVFQRVGQKEEKEIYLFEPSNESKWVKTFELSEDAVDELLGL